MPTTESPRNSRRSLEAVPGFSEHQERCESASIKRDRSENLWPRRSWSESARRECRLPVSSGDPELGGNVVHRVTHGAQILEVLVVDPKILHPVSQLLFERLH